MTSGLEHEWDAGRAELEWAGERLVLLPERAVWWPAARTIFVADTHFGKDSAFRAASIPIPTGTTDHDLDRLDRVLRLAEADRLVVLGDFYHARSGRSDALSERLDAWRKHHEALDLVIVRGNHDLHAGDVPEAWSASVLDGPAADGPFLLAHDENDLTAAASGFALTGHVHPGVRLSGAGGTGLVLPCFRFGHRTAVLPAFGSFTGLHMVRPARRDQVYVVADGEVHRVG